MSTDNEVIERSIGSPEEFAALYDRYAATIHRYAARRIGTEVADDILSETFLVASINDASSMGLRPMPCLGCWESRQRFSNSMPGRKQWRGEAWSLE